MLAAGTAGLIVNATLWVHAARQGRRIDRLHERRRLVVLAYFAAVLAGTALVWTALL